MRFVLAYAGIPTHLYSAIEKKRTSLVGGNAEFEGLPRNFRGTAYDERHRDFFQERFLNRARAEPINDVSVVGHAIIYLNADFESTKWFVSQFFPHTLMVRVEWQQDSEQGESEMRGRGPLWNALLSATKDAKTHLIALRNELNSGAARTPLLLPPKNFRHSDYRGLLEEVQSVAVGGAEKEELIRQRVEAWRKQNPLKSFPYKNKPCYVDEEDREFHPAKITEYHGLKRYTDDKEHLPGCFLGGRRRLGAPYEPRFHYDCGRGEEDMEARLHTCHSVEMSTVVGDPHVNIAPNDHIRGQKKQRPN